MNYDAYGNPIKPPRSSGVLVPLLLALLASAAGNYWLWKERTKLSGDAIKATAKASALEAVQKEMTERLASLEAEKAGLVEAKEQAVKDAQAKATELAKLKDDVAGVEVEKEEDADEKGKDDKGKGKDAKGKDAKADKKAEAKAKAKEKEKKEKKKKAAKKENGAEKSSVDREL
jgi:histone H1/5